ncbi:RILP-like protein 1 [Bienertia sinuspersici]
MKPTKRDLFKYKAKPNSLSTTKPTTKKRALPPPPCGLTPEPSPPPSSQPIFSWLSQSQQDLCTTPKGRRIKCTLCYSSNMLRS